MINFKFIYAYIILCCISSLNVLFAQERLDTIIPVRGFCIAAPQPKYLDPFIKFVNEELAPRSVNVLILRVDFNYQFVSHPELRDSNALSKEEVKKLVKACAKNKIKIIPQINLLGHQSWASDTYNLLKVYPEFDETPWVKMPKTYAWPNDDNLYCKSYCPLHPSIHKVVFDLIDEICEVYSADAFHAGMDEVFYLGESKCPRCGGHDKAELFAKEVCTLRDHLAQKGKNLWIWGDRLLDGKTTGLGEWEASYNTTYRAIDLIPKDVTICDWHYEKPEKTAVYFAMKGFNVMTCPWRAPKLATIQVNDVVKFRQESSVELKNHFQGLIQTVWSDTGTFLDDFYATKTPAVENTPENCFRVMYQEILKYK